MTKLVMPSGLTEAEQGDWFFDHQEELANEYLASPASKNPTRGVSARRLGLPTILELPADDASMAIQQARREGIEFKQYTAQVLHEALLERELKKAS